MWRLLKLGMLLTGIMFAAQVAVLVGGRLTYHDPLARYTAFMPGHSIDELADYSCQFLACLGSAVVFANCKFKEEDGVLRQAALVVSHHIITKTYFTVIPYRLTLGM